LTIWHWIKSDRAEGTGYGFNRKEDFLNCRAISSLTGLAYEAKRKNHPWDRM
jgi:hypothetical protein